MRSKTLLLVLTALYYVHFSSVNALGTITAERQTINEGESIQLCVSLDPLVDVTVELQVSIISPTAAEGLDFDLSAKMIVFTVDGPSEQCVDFLAHDDSAVESGELVAVRLGGVPTDDLVGVLITIQDTSRINLSFTSQSYSVGEDDGTVQVCVVIVGGSLERSLTVTIESDNTGTARDAEANNDYIFTGGSIQFNPTMSSEPVCSNIAIQSDAIIEEDETFLVRIMPGLEAVNVIMGSVTVTIIDTDGATLTVSQSLIQLPEGDSGLTDVNIGLVVSLNGNTLDRNITVLVNTVDAQATAENNDFVPLDNAVFTIPPSATDGETVTYTAYIVGDVVQEISERYNIEFATVDSEDQFETNRVIVRILDDADVVNDCGGLGDPADGQVIITPDTLQESVATYSCDVGYNLNGMESRTCLNSGWEGEAASCQIVDCGTLMEPEQGSIQISTTEYQGQAIYGCDSGFELLVDVEMDTRRPSFTRTCELSGNWSEEAPPCVRVRCGFLAEPDNGIVHYPDGDTLFGQRAQYACDPGYNLDGTPERTCQASREWSLTAPTCQPVNCGELTDPVNGNVMVSSNFFPGVANYSCSTNFELVNGPEQRNCQASGTWSENAPTCQVIQCPALMSPNDGTVNIQVDIEGNTVATYRCNECFELEGGSERMCQPNREWSGSVPTCNIIVCPDQVAPVNGDVSVDSTICQSVAVYSCDAGFTRRGSQTAVCQSTGAWSSMPPFCEIVSCPVLDDPTDGSVTFSQLVFNSEAVYSCDSGFVLDGPSTRVCQETGQWSGEAPVCQLVSCPVLEDPSNGNVVFSQRVVNSEAVYSCDIDFVLDGPSTRVCQDNGEWSGETPVCLFACTGMCTFACPLLEVANGTVNATNGNYIGSVAQVECNENLTLVGNDSLTCNSSAMWSDEIPTCVFACPNITIVNGNVSYTNETLPGSEANVTCEENFIFTGPESRTCMEDGTWSGEDNSCTLNTVPPGGASIQLGTSTIIGIAVGGVLFLIVIFVIIAVAVLICSSIRKKKIYKKYVLPYRDYIYANSQRNSGGPLSDAEIRMWETQTRQHAVDAVDALEKT